MPILHWLNDEDARKFSSRVPYRLLEADTALSYGDPSTENMLIQGDNLEALKALLPYYAGQVKCIYIDPPYNTRSAFEHYDDNLEHSIWLSTMYPRLELLRDLLADDGSIWVSIDDNEGHYLKVLMDEVFGRQNFITTIVWQQRTTRENRKTFSSNHEFLLIYAREYSRFASTRNDLDLTEEVKSRYKNPDNDPRGPWQSVSANAQAGHGTASQFYTLIAPNGRRHDPPKGTCWRYTLEKVTQEIASNNIWFGKDGNGVPRIKKFLSEAKAGLTPETLWLAEEVGTNDFAKKHLIELFRDADLFDTPKPESLISRVAHIATNPGDLVLDSFLGSGTTAAVAHKMGRRYIGIEMGEHAVTHCAPRLQKVVDGEQGGISKEVNWQGGGGFHFYHLGETIFNEEGQINPAVKFRPLAAHVWFTETHTPLFQNVIASPEGAKQSPNSKSKIASSHTVLRSVQGKTLLAMTSPLLGIHNGIAYYLLYNGILGDKSKDGGNVLTGKVLASLPPHHGPKVIYGELTTFGSQRLTREQIVFKQVPYDIKAR